MKITPGSLYVNLNNWTFREGSKISFDSEEADVLKDALERFRPMPMKQIKVADPNGDHFMMFGRSEMNVCPNCGAPADIVAIDPVTAEFCWKCGQNLIKSKEERKNEGDRRTEKAEGTD